jgi:hypothetical protein
MSSCDDCCLLAMCRRAVWRIFTDVSVEHSASLLEVEERRSGEHVLPRPSAHICKVHTRACPCRPSAYICRTYTPACPADRRPTSAGRTPQHVHADRRSTSARRTPEHVPADHRPTSTGRTPEHVPADHRPTSTGRTPEHVPADHRPTSTGRMPHPTAVVGPSLHPRSSELCFSALPFESRPVLLPATPVLSAPDLTLPRAGGHSGNALDLYSGCARFEPWSEHRLS